MAIPDNFSPFEHLQDLIRKLENKKITKYFRNVDVDADIDLTVPEQALKYACTHQDNDTANMTILRCMLFYVLLNNEETFKDEYPPVLGMISSDIQTPYRPQVKLFFKEDTIDVEDGYDPLWTEISYRLVNEKSETLTEVGLGKLAAKIKAKYEKSGGYTIKKGKNKYTYLDKLKGYDFRLLCRDSTEARRVIEDVMELQGDVFEASKLDEIKRENEMDAFPTIPEKKTILGKSRQMPRKRPIATVRFAYSHIHVHGLTNPIALYSRITDKLFTPKESVPTQ